MEAFYITAVQLAILTILFLTGYFIKKKNYISGDAVKGLSFLLLSVSTPATIIVSLQADFSAELFSLGVAMILSYAAVMLLGCLVSLAAALVFKVKGAERRVWLACGAMFNGFFIGGPITKALYGDMAMVYVCFGMLGWNLISYSLVIRIFTGKREGGVSGRIKGLLATPAIIACLTSFVLFSLRIKLPYPVLSSLELLAQMTTPLSMLVFGAISSSGGFKKFFAGKNVYIFSLLRLIIIPLALIPAFTLLIPDPVARDSVLLGAAMPAATAIPVFAETFGGCGEEGSKYCIVTTILSLVSLPLMSAVISML